MALLKISADIDHIRQAYSIFKAIYFPLSTSFWIFRSPTTGLLDSQRSRVDFGKLVVFWEYATSFSLLLSFEDIFGRIWL